MNDDCVNTIALALTRIGVELIRSAAHQGGADARVSVGVAAIQWAEHLQRGGPTALNQIAEHLAAERDEERERARQRREDAEPNSE